MRTKHLTALTITLFILSLTLYTFENQRGTDIVSGSDFIKGLDAEGINKIVINFKEKEELVFERDNDKFIILNHKSYSADSDKINDFIYKMASMQVKSKVASNVSIEDLDKYDLGEKTRKYKVDIYDKNNQKTVSFKVGKDHKNRGTFLVKEGSKDVYLSDKMLWFNDSHFDFINQKVLEFDKTEIQSLTLKGKENIEILKDGESYKVAGAATKEAKKEEVEKLTGKITDLEFTDFYKYNEDTIKNLKFAKGITVKLQNKMAYEMLLSKDKEDHFLRISALTSDIPEKLVINPDDDKEKIKNIENIINVQDKAQRFNLEKGKWVYKIDKDVFEGLMDSKSLF